MSNTGARPPRRTPGASSVAGRRGGRPPWLLPLLGLAAVVALLLLLSRCGGDDEVDPEAAVAPATTAAALPGSSAAAASTPQTTAAGSAGATAQAAPAATDAGDAGGTVIAGGEVVLDAEQAKDLASHDGQPAVARLVRVQSVPADEGFWAGASADDRVWVQLTGAAGESPYQVQVGDVVDFTGTVTAVPDGFAESIGLDESEGASQLAQQKHYIAVQKTALALAR